MILDELNDYPQGRGAFGPVSLQITFRELLVRAFETSRRHLGIAEKIQTLKYAIVLGVDKERYASKYSDSLQRLIKEYADFSYANPRFDQQIIRMSDMETLRHGSAAIDPILGGYSPVKKIDSYTSDQLLSEVVDFSKCSVEFANPSLNARRTPPKRAEPKKGFWASLFG